MSVTWRVAWCRSTSTPRARVQPAVLPAALEQRRALAVDDVEQHPGAIGVGGREGVERHSGRRGHGADDDVGVGPLAEPSTSTTRPVALAWASVSGLASSRTMSVTRVEAARSPAPAATASTAERAVAPEPTTTTSVTASDMRSQPTAARAAVMPCTSVLSASQPPSTRTKVLAAPVSRAVGLASTASCNATSLSGIVSESPRHVPSRPSSAAAKPSASTSRRS